MAYRISQPLAATQFSDDDKPKKKSKQKRENRKAVRQLKKKTTTRVVKGLKVDKKRILGSGLTSKQENKVARLKKIDTRRSKNNYVSNRSKIKKDELLEKNKAKARKQKQKEKDKLTWSNATPAEKENMLAQQKRTRKGNKNVVKSQSQIDKKKARKAKRSNKGIGEGPMCGNKPGKCKI